jgi:hypothetical protein
VRALSTAAGLCSIAVTGPTSCSIPASEPVPAPRYPVSKAILHEIKSQEIQTQKELEQITSRLYNAKQELGSSDNTSIFTDKEKDFIKDQIGAKQDTKGIIEAASVVTASLKSKLSMAQKEVETVQQLLEKERKEHTLTKEKLKRLQGKESKNKS